MGSQQKVLVAKMDRLKTVIVSLAVVSGILLLTSATIWVYIGLTRGMIPRASAAGAHLDAVTLSSLLWAKMTASAKHPRSPHRSRRSRSPQSDRRRRSRSRRERAAHSHPCLRGCIRRRAHAPRPLFRRPSAALFSRLRHRRCRGFLRLCGDAMETRRYRRCHHQDRRILALHIVAGIRSGASSRWARSRRSRQPHSQLHHRLSIDSSHRQSPPGRKRC